MAQPSRILFCSSFVCVCVCVCVCVSVCVSVCDEEGRFFSFKSNIIIIIIIFIIFIIKNVSRFFFFLSFFLFAFRFSLFFCFFLRFFFPFFLFLLSLGIVLEYGSAPPSRPCKKSPMSSIGGAGVADGIALRAPSR